MADLKKQDQQLVCWQAFQLVCQYGLLFSGRTRLIKTGVNVERFGQVTILFHVIPCLRFDFTGVQLGLVKGEQHEKTLGQDSLPYFTEPGHEAQLESLQIARRALNL